MLKRTILATLAATTTLATPVAAQQHRDRTVVIERTVVEDRGPDDRRPDDRGMQDRRMEEGRGWDRRALHGYGFRQTARGARLSLSGDVLFATDSDVLRPGAIERLRPLARYLRANPGVRVAIDGFTDARGSDAHNQDLSERRAASVRAAFDDMGVTRARFSVAGHGEANPVAPNTTPQGMRQNRRVEVTLLGRRATEF
jgi:outer membrane protein OmpA-like peptidoglycan-associated protein